MTAIESKPVSAANLAAALATGGGSSQTAGKPVSAENLAAVLAHVAGTTLFHGPGTENSVSLSDDVRNYDYVVFVDYATWNQERQGTYVNVCPSSTVTGGGSCGTTPGFGGMRLSAEPSGTRLTLDPDTTTHHYFVTDVVGVRVQS